MLGMQASFVFASLAVLAGASLGGEPADDGNSMNSQSATIIAEALSVAKDQPATERLKTFQAVAKVVQERCPTNVLIADQLQTATSSESLEAALRTSYELLTFKMKEEADLPAGFPQPTPVGEIQVKSYPAYRLARAASQNDSAFFTLFAHITLNRIAMTAPVEMTYGTAGTEKQPQQTNMAFLYGERTLGKVGNKLGGVKVEDIRAMTTVSIGLKGDSNLKKLSELEQRLEKWLEQHGPNYERAGNLRVLGYNSPGVPSDSRYYEVEIPIKQK